MSVAWPRPSGKERESKGGLLGGLRQHDGVFGDGCPERGSVLFFAEDKIPGLAYD